MSTKKRRTWPPAPISPSTTSLSLASRSVVSAPHPSTVGCGGATIVSYSPPPLRPLRPPSTSSQIFHFSSSNMDIKSECGDEVSDLEEEDLPDAPFEDFYNDDSDVDEIVSSNQQIRQLFSKTIEEEESIESNNSNRNGASNLIFNDTHSSSGCVSKWNETSGGAEGGGRKAKDNEENVIWDGKDVRTSSGGGRVQPRRIENLPTLVEKNLEILTKSSGKLANTYFDIVFKNRNAIVQNHRANTETINVGTTEIKLEAEVFLDDNDEKPDVTDLVAMDFGGGDFSDNSRSGVDEEQQDEVVVKRKRGRPKNSELKARKLKKEKQRRREKERRKKRKHAEKLREELKQKLKLEKVVCEFDGDVDNIKFEYDEFFDGVVPLYEPSSSEDEPADEDDEEQLLEYDEWQCRHCVVKCRSHDLLLRHYTKEHGGYDWSSLCYYCGYFNGHKKMIYLHIKDHYAPKKREMKICDICSAEVLHLQQHQKAAHSGVCYECPFCLKNFTRKAELNIHIKAVHMKHQLAQRFVCQYCQKDFPFMKYLKRHLRIHAPLAHVPNPYKCTACNATFNNKSSLNAHKNTCPNRELLNRDLLPNQTGSVSSRAAESPSLGSTSHQSEISHAQQHHLLLTGGLAGHAHANTVSATPLAHLQPALPPPSGIPLSRLPQTNSTDPVRIQNMKHLSKSSAPAGSRSGLPVSTSSAGLLNVSTSSSSSPQEIQLVNSTLRELTTGNVRELSIGLSRDMAVAIVHTPATGSSSSTSSTRDDAQIDLSLTSSSRVGGLSASREAATARELQLVNSAARELQLTNISARDLQQLADVPPHHLHSSLSLASGGGAITTATSGGGHQAGEASSRDWSQEHAVVTEPHPGSTSPSETTSAGVTTIHFPKFERPQMYYY